MIIIDSVYKFLHDGRWQYHLVVFYHSNKFCLPSFEFWYGFLEACDIARGIWRKKRRKKGMLSFRYQVKRWIGHHANKMSFLSDHTCRSIMTAIAIITTTTTCDLVVAMHCHRIVIKKQSWFIRLLYDVRVTNYVSGTSIQDWFGIWWENISTRSQTIDFDGPSGYHERCEKMMCVVTFFLYDIAIPAATTSQVTGAAFSSSSAVGRLDEDLFWWSSNKTNASIKGAWPNSVWSEGNRTSLYFPDSYPIREWCFVKPNRIRILFFGGIMLLCFLLSNFVVRVRCSSWWVEIRMMVGSFENCRYALRQKIVRFGGAIWKTDLLSNNMLIDVAEFFIDLPKRM